MKLAKQIKLLIAVPAGTEVKTDFALSLAMLATDLSFPIAGYQHQFDITFVKGSILPMLRQHLVDAALKREATHILFLDSDMRFPADTARRLIRHNEMIVACNCTTRVLPPVPTARVENGEMQGAFVYQSPGDTGLQEVWRVGMGVMLVDMRVFEALHRPHFSVNWDEEHQNYLGEDWGFCKEAQKAGFKVLIDKELSNEIGHIGQLTYEHQYVERADDDKAA